MAEYYGVKRSSEYLAHYGRPGQRPGQHLPDIKKKYESGAKRRADTLRNTKEKLEQLQNVQQVTVDKSSSRDAIASHNAFKNARDQLERLKSLRDYRNRIPTRKEDPKERVAQILERNKKRINLRR